MGRPTRVEERKRQSRSAVKKMSRANAMSKELYQSIREVESAIGRLNEAFQHHIEELRGQTTPEEFKQWIARQSAMRDSGMLYLTWARHYVQSASSEQEEAEFEMRKDELF